VVPVKPAGRVLDEADLLYAFPRLTAMTLLPSDNRDDRFAWKDVAQYPRFVALAFATRQR
jgi:hypothetical protein